MTHSMKPGDIFYCHFDEPIKARPVVILSRPELNAVRQNVVVALVTRTVRNIPLEISVGNAEGLPKKGVISLGDIHTVPKSLLSEKKGTLSPQKLSTVSEGLRLLFALSG